MACKWPALARRPTSQVGVAVAFRCTQTRRRRRRPRGPQVALVIYHNWIAIILAARLVEANVGQNCRMNLVAELDLVGVDV